MKKREEDTAELIEQMFLNRPLTPEAAAQVMKDRKWTEQEAQMVLDGLFAKAYSSTTSTVVTDEQDHSSTENTTNLQTTMLNADVAAPDLTSTLAHCL